VDVEFEEVEEGVGYEVYCAVELWRRLARVKKGIGERVGAPFSTPKKSSSGRPVSLQIGNGMYCSCPLASVIYPLQVSSMPVATSPFLYLVGQTYMFTCISDTTSALASIDNISQAPNSHSPV
jgi:hypothetical protein